MERLMFSDDEMVALDDFKLNAISRLMRILARPTTRVFHDPFVALDAPRNKYEVGARFNVGMDVFKVVSCRTRGRRFSMSVRFDGQLGD